MQFTSEQHLDSASGRGGVLERRFVLGDIPGILWTPGSGSAPAPLVLVGHPGGLPTMYPRLVARAVHAVANGFAAATIELPGCGERPRSVAADEARAELRQAVAAGAPGGPREKRSGGRAPGGRARPPRGGPPGRGRGGARLNRPAGAGSAPGGP